ncbi:hypothetical protein RI367_000204 [Sorochytrium milnesiophthora]
MTDMFDLGAKYSADEVARAFDAHWNQEVKRVQEAQRRGKQAKPRVTRVLLRSFGRQWYFSAVCKLLGDAATMMAPLAIHNLLQFIDDYVSADDPPHLKHGLLLVTLLFVLQAVGALATHTFWFHAQMAGLKARTALTSAAYAKALRLSNGARQEWNTGKIMNVVATDLARIENAAIYLHMLWTSPVQVLIGIVLLVRLVGVAALGGLGVFLLLLPFQTGGMSFVARKRRDAQLVSDQRVKLINELLQGIKIVKILTWEVPLFNKIGVLRLEELALSRKVASLKAVIIGMAHAAPALGSCAVFVIYAALGNKLDASTVFSSLALFNLIRLPMWQLPQSLAFVMDAKVAIVRLSGLLVAEELTTLPTIVNDPEYAIQLEGASFTWDADQPPATHPDDAAEEAEETDPLLAPEAHLCDITLKIPHGKLVAVVGRVGSCKTSLLNGIIGEMKRTAGSVKLSGTVAYCSQSAWIQNATLLDNILFGRPMNRSRYDVVIRNACLERDLQQLPDGELTEIGEKGINVSGGQKARINLARALYSDPDIYLLDDVLAAVDAHVGARLFNDCIKGHLQGKTRILVTHALSYVSQCDYVIVMDNGRIKEMGTFDECMAQDGHFADLIRSYGGAGGDESDDSSSGNSIFDDSAVVDDDHRDVPSILVSSGQGTTLLGSPRGVDHVNVLSATGDAPGARKLMTTEERALGAVRLRVYARYVKYCGGWGPVGFVLFLVVFTQGVRIGNDLWLVWWTSKTFPHLTKKDYMMGYLYFSIAQSLLLVLSGVLFAFVGTHGARTMHEAALARLLRAPMSFFDQTPLGRILSRFSKDCDIVSNTLYDAYRTFSRNFIVALSSLVFVCAITPALIAPLVVLSIVYYMIQRFYRASSRELKRLESLSRSPLYAQFGETLSGIPTIRAYREEARFIEINRSLIDINNRPYFGQVTAPRWLGVRLELCSTLLVTTVGLLGILGDGTVSPALIGAALSTALQVTHTLNICVREGAEAESQMNAVERLDYYAQDIPSEAPAELPDVQPPAEWPQRGEVTLRHLTMSYRTQDNLPPVLKDINVRIPSGARVGIVGRTGAGKSSIVTALLRLVEATEGKILIDDIDISKIGLRDLRSRIAIIPQDPVLFSGTIRNNLDRFNEYEDAQLWDRLQRAGLYDTVASSDDKLDMVVAENGENLSLGERCCLCLARAMMGNRKILIMDEATASVDLATEERIQHSLRRDFAGVTILTIAHRLNTVIDYDYILSLDAGQVVEFDHPHVLVNRPGSLFASLVDETGPANAQMLRSLAANAQRESHVIPPVQASAAY